MDTNVSQPKRKTSLDQLFKQDGFVLVSGPKGRKGREAKEVSTGVVFDLFCVCFLLASFGSPSGRKGREAKEVSTGVVFDLFCVCFLLASFGSPSRTGEERPTPAGDGFACCKAGQHVHHCAGREKT